MTRIVHVRQDRNHMATTFEFTISCDEGVAALAGRVLDQAHQRVRQLEREISEFLPTSAVHRLNHAAVADKIVFSTDAMILLQSAVRLQKKTQGSFDCLAKSCGLPAGEAGIAWEPSTRQVWKTHKEARLGFGAIGKGYALDRASQWLEENGFTDYRLIAGGSSIVLSGFAAPGDPWQWAWSWKKETDGRRLGLPFQLATGARIAIGVSGTEEKGSHLLDRRAQRRDALPAVLPQVASALVTCPSATDADALATALFIEGRVDAPGFAADLPQAPALALVDRQDTLQCNSAFRRLWHSIPGIALFTQAALADEAVDLRADDAWGTASSFAPYFYEKSPVWIVLPILAVGMLLLHLTMSKTRIVKRKKRGRK